MRILLVGWKLVVVYGGVWIGGLTVILKVLDEYSL
jgi:hypothetical protein